MERESGDADVREDKVLHEEVQQLKQLQHTPQLTHTTQLLH